MFWYFGMCWRYWKREPSHLPYAEGPYVPGCADLMTEYSEKGSFVRLYYPTSLSHIEECSSSWIPWIAHQRYIEGFSRLLHIWKFIIRLVLWLLAGDIRIPVAWNADIHVGGNKLPVVVFSHGLGGSRFLYSTLCTELASHGFLVAAVEHRDKSASATFYLESEDNSSPKWIDYQEVQLGAGHHTNRSMQVQQRASECVRAIDLLEKINKGLPVKNVLAECFDLRNLKDSLDMSRITMMGHSFGGATALLTLAQDCRLGCGVILDAWMFPIKGYSSLSKSVRQPLLFVNTWTFHTSPNYEALSKFIEESDNRMVFTIRGTTHESQTDTPHVIGHWLNFGKKKLSPYKAGEINRKLILEFLKDKIGLEHETNNSFILAQNAPYIVSNLVKWQD